MYFGILNPYHMRNALMRKISPKLYIAMDRSMLPGKPVDDNFYFLWFLVVYRKYQDFGSIKLGPDFMEVFQGTQTAWTPGCPKVQDDQFRPMVFQLYLR